ncbi:MULTISPECIES: VanZ family protein [unclassified Lysinibacillus]|uniref:VanZ family protein n=1 Tax=unclassified Lysinibacillus TaxID=2636778 RepID=UPI0008838D4F|nr:MULTISPECIES: VanZ family protein [unclassified Lysinibacillus]SCY51486.1 Glycopeptide antibiotics resistance protein [Lysinibacillus sp. SG9]SDB22506.1 Glycopeptide antibiotics resistance protein [Lysinibacillus sp. TC-37]SFS72186.1 Glycopeptide antibiotics resistance protein [Lysinibacillus sp. SG55]
MLSLSKNNITDVHGNAKLPLPYRDVIDTYYLPLKVMGWILFSIYSFIAFYKLVIDRLVNVVVVLLQGDYSIGDLGLFDYSSWRLTTNFVPFETILRYINYSQYFNWDIIIVNLLGNLLIFTPMGFLLPLLSKKFRKAWVIICLGFFASLAVETIQFIFTVGSADIDDLILNTIGAWLGYIAYKGILIRPKK